MSDHLKRLADVLERRTPGPWYLGPGRRQILTDAAGAPKDFVCMPHEDDAQAICAAVNCIGALLAVAEAALGHHDASFILREELAALDAAIAKELP